VDVLQKLYKCYMDTDASLVEINPLNRDSKGNIMALDAKFNFDANALFRHPEIVALPRSGRRRPGRSRGQQVRPGLHQPGRQHRLPGQRRRLAMATMDTIKLFGGEPANFLDVGGGATAEKVTEAFKIMLKNPKVKASWSTSSAAS
jgi:succinyl-CoA synthetase beta subunit